jgi:tRNA-specific 2-thiouridylase
MAAGTENLKKVVVALSGGVDSCVAAAKLKDLGYEVTGVTMRLWSEPDCEAENRCCTPETRAAAQRQADALGIPFHILDATDAFRDEVVQSFLDGYACGDTPNPCIICNRRIKWGMLLDFARELGAEQIATGHYARVLQNLTGEYELWRGADPAKDQSYFLCLLTQQQLARTLFPLGEMTKKDVRAFARERSLPAADLPESQDLCFLGGVDYRTFLEKYVPQVAAPGPVVGRDGRILGEHHGLAFYTIGQRKGLPPASRPLYVLRKDLAANQLVAGFAEELGQRELRTAQVNWISGRPPAADFQVQVMIRSRAVPAEARVLPQADGGAQVVFDQPLRDITPGQMAVFYDSDRVLGGGVILSDS